MDIYVLGYSESGDKTRQLNPLDVMVRDRRLYRSITESCTQGISSKTKYIFFLSWGQLLCSLVM